jgi:small nuclear ribonucleoprotein (snRNP)-like protein
VLVCDDQEANHGFLTVTGTLKGYDQLMNLVLDNVEEVTRGMF